jgi:hypothetical protein
MVFKLYVNGVLNSRNLHFTRHEQLRASQTLNFAHKHLHVYSFHITSEQLNGSQKSLTQPFSMPQGLRKA